jgi:hypothetical protein
LSGSGASGQLTSWSGTSALTGSASATISAGTITATDFVISSDSRLKDVHGRIKEGLDIVEDISGVRYTWNETARKLGKDSVLTQLGVIAQDVQAVLPEAVLEDDNGYLTVKYERLIPVLIEAIKTLSQRVTQLELEI